MNGESDRIAGASAIAAPAFQLFEKPRVEVRAKIVEAHFLRWLPEFVTGENSQ
ncbi:MAG: hypothetical protein OXI87_14340 [Albidovulum sp.]|nr:hypothetical protein [Albidovulum sp.]MDE0532597.1 hypothetical protein [Albidovulum sp.]